LLRFFGDPVLKLRADLYVQSPWTGKTPLRYSSATAYPLGPDFCLVNVRNVKAFFRMGAQAGMQDHT
jgi:hypothetical protein